MDNTDIEDRRPDYEIYSDISWNFWRRHEPTNGYGHSTAVKSNRNSQVSVRTAWCPVARNIKPEQTGTDNLELRGMVDAILYFIDTHQGMLDPKNPVEVVVFCDNQNSVRRFNQMISMTRGQYRQVSKLWQRNDILKREWYRATHQRSVKVRAEWVKGHGGNKWNNMVDNLARSKRFQMEPRRTRVQWTQEQIDQHLLAQAA